MISRMALLALLLAGIFDPENVAQIRVSLGILKVKVFSPTRLREPHLAPCTAYHVPRTLLAAPLTLNPYTAPCFLHLAGCTAPCFLHLAGCGLPPPCTLMGRVMPTCLQLSTLHPSCRRVCGGGRRFRLWHNLAVFRHH